MRRSHALVALLVWFLVGWLAACTVSRNPVSGRKRLFAYTWKQEIALGQQADREIVAQYGIYDDPELAAYVQEVGTRVLEQSHLRRPEADPEFRNTPFTFRVLDSPVVNAFALPGGFVYVTRGLLAHLQNEAQLAVVLGHEIGHVAARHTSQRMLETNVGQLGLMAGAVVGEKVLGVPGQDILQIGGTLVQLLFLKYSRDHEREADRLGVEYAALSGYRVDEAASFFRTLRRLTVQQGAELPFFLSTHPDPGEREETIRRLARSWREKVSMERVAQDALFARLEGLVYGEDPRQGFVQDGYFYHPTLRFFFPIPAGWEVINEAHRVLLVAPEQEAIMDLRPVEARSAKEAADAFLQNEAFFPVRQQTVRLGSMPSAYRVEVLARDEAQTYRILAYFIEYNGTIYRFLGLSDEAQFARWAPLFQNTIEHLAPLTDSRILNIKPLRIYIAPAPRTARFQELIPATTPPTLTPEELAILNQVERTTIIRAGTRLKWVR